MLNNMSVKTKLLAGFGLLLLLLLATALMALNKMSSIQSAMDDALNDRYPKIMFANSVIKTTLDNGRLVRNAALADDQAEIESTIKQIDDNRARNGETLNKLEKILSTAKGKELFAAITAANAPLTDAYAKLYPVLHANQDKESFAFIKKMFAPANNNYMTALEALATYQNDLIEKQKTEAEANYQEAKWAMIILTVAALGIGITVALLLASRISTPLNDAVQLAGRIADGDLTASNTPAVVASRDEVSQLMAALETMRSKLALAFREIRDNTGYVADSARELSSMSQQVASSAQRQAESTASAAATLEQLTVSITHVADNADDASQQATYAGQLAEQGGNEVKTSVSRILSVSNSVHETAGEMANLTKEVQEIGNIVTVIRDVADQTNLLALNAAIEAARAGEMGRGFAVVADEVRKLAERTTVSAQEITRMVSSIQQNAGRAVGSMEHSRQSVTSVTDSADKTSSAMQQVQGSASGVLSAVKNINNALGEQRGASQDLAKNMEQVAQMAEENSATVEELATTSGQLMSLAQNLQGVTARFRL